MGYDLNKDYNKYPFDNYRINILQSGGGSYFYGMVY